MQRKLLILGGNILSKDIVNKAKEMGYYTIVSDWNSPEDSPAKLIADEYWNVSLCDYDELLKRIKSSNVEGIITGFTDSYLLPYQHICELAGLPCYASKESIRWSIDKDEFKKVCRKNDVPVVPEYDVNSFNPECISNTNKVIIKPVDNSGSRGIIICDSKENFESDLNFSLTHSPSRHVLIEKYMDCDDVSLEYILKDGEIKLSSICDRYIYKSENGGSVTSGLIYPSKYIDTYMEKYDRKVRDMYSKKGLKNGVLFMQAFVEDGQFYFYEMGYRLSGGRHFLFSKNQSGTSSVEELINYAMTGSMSSDLMEKVNPRFNDVCCQLSVIGRSQQIYRMGGVKSDLPQIIDALFMYREGDTVGMQGTAASILARYHIVSKSFKELDEVLIKIKEKLIVENDKGENLLLPFFR